MYIIYISTLKVKYTGSMSINLFIILNTNCKFAYK